MRTELVNIKASEARYQLQYYKNLYLADKKPNKNLSILFITIIICLIAFLVYYYLKFQ